MGEGLGEGLGGWCIRESPEGHEKGKVDGEEPHELSVAGGHAIAVKGDAISFCQRK